MKILVPIKRVIDAYVNIRVKQDLSGVETRNVKMSLNSFCEIAVEESIRIKENDQADEIVVISIGSKNCETTLRNALAMGADRAILVQTADDQVELMPLAIAKILKHIVEKESFDLVMTGKQSIDTDNNQTGQMLAALLGWPQGTFASKIEINNEELIVTREIDGGLETLALKLPAVVTTDLRLNEPRYPKLPNIMKAKKKPLEVLPIAETGVDLTSRLIVKQVTSPPARPAGTKVANVEELLDKLKNEAGVLSS